MMANETHPIAGVVLAGGRARRMGGNDKSFLLLHDRPLLQRAIERLAPQVGSLVVSANGSIEQYARFHAPVIADTVDGSVGPLAGLLAGMGWARANAPGASWIASVAVDTPFFPRDLVARLSAAAGARRIVAAMSGGRVHPVVALTSIDLADDLAAFLDAGTSFKVSDWLARHEVALVAFDEAAHVDPFFNINTLDDLAEAEAIAAGCAGT